MPDLLTSYYSVQPSNATYISVTIPDADKAITASSTTPFIEAYLDANRRGMVLNNLTTDINDFKNKLVELNPNIFDENGDVKAGATATTITWPDKSWLVEKRYLEASESAT